jgi:hypothetical protein
MKLKSLFKSGAVRKAMVAGALSLFAISVAFALNTDQTRIFSKRDLGIQALHYYRLTINYNDPGISSGAAFGALGQNTYVNSIDCHVTTAFNASTTNTVTLGTSTAATQIVSASGANASITAGTLGVYHLTAAPGVALNATSDADHTLYAKYAQTGTAATAGAVTCVISYAPNNDM